MKTDGLKTRQEDKVYGLIQLHQPISPQGLIDMCRAIKLTPHKIKTSLEHLSQIGKIEITKDAYGTYIITNY